MAARGSFALANPSSVDVTLTITMSAKEWKIVRERLRPSDSNGEWYLDAAIYDLLEKANKEFRFYEDVDPAERAKAANP